MNNLPTAEKELVEAIGDAEVRKPLANILAICALLKEKDNTEEDTNSYYEILDQQVREMDQKLKEVEVKLHEYN
ncbi:protein kinase family protein [Pedobacter westerhofensis]|uniref:hypothetical protein n=1 Tax=Pedobacter westerhofensis TaxID=425512 RepID=UPI00115AE84A|nr:hypothetical protein [Pedobacter westerhofensis]